MKRFLLDTNIISHLVDHPEGKVAAEMAPMPRQTACTSIVVACELHFGVAKRGSQRLAEAVKAALQRIEILPLTASAQEHYARLRLALEREGTPIGANDMLIAAHALALDCTLVTDNEREFRRVPGLKVENWIR